MSKFNSNNEFDSLEAFFSDKLKDASMQPSDKAWQQIEASLNKNKKRKRRFIWIFFSGFFLLGIASYFTFFDNSNSNTSSSSNLKKNVAGNQVTATSMPAKNGNVNKEGIDKSVNAVKNVPIEEKSRLVKIQIGAFKKQKDTHVFSNLHLDVKSERLANGITRYYAEVPENEVQKNLEQIQQAGFTDAFIKNNNDLPVTNHNTYSQQQNKTAAIAAKNKSDAITTPKEPVSSMIRLDKTQTHTASAKQNEMYQSNKVVAGINKTESATLTKKEPVSQTKTNTEISSESDKNKQDSVSDSGIVAKTDSKTSTTTSKEPVTPIAAKDSATNSVVQKDSVKNEMASTKKDSVVAKPDSVKPAAPVVKVDSSNKSVILNRWALILTGGPNFIQKNIQSNLFATPIENQPNTYNATLKAEFKPFKRLAFSAGASYSYFIAQQDATLFYFDKRLTGDYLFYSSYGPMPVDKNTMLQDFSPLAPINIFHASYSYSSRINTLLVPVQAKFYYLNSKRINLFADVGISGMMVLSQQTNLYIIKEHIINQVSYNRITTNRFNALLMFGLGGDVRIYKNLYFTADGGFRYGLTNLSNTTGTTSKPAYFSANGGLKIKF